MRSNTPVTNREIEFEGKLVSMTDERGVITHCNRSFASLSGFSYDELIGQSHNIIRHPSMPAAAFKDMWQTIEAGIPWVGIVQNRCKNGDHYWVQAHVTPMIGNGKPFAYLSVRTKPSDKDLADAIKLHAKLNLPENKNSSKIIIKNGEISEGGFLNRIKQIPSISFTKKIALISASLLGLIVAANLLPFDGSSLLLIQGIMALIGGSASVAWISSLYAKEFENSSLMATDLAGCNLTSLAGQTSTDSPLNVNLNQIQVNMQAVVGDIRAEMQAMSEQVVLIGNSSCELATRAGQQSEALSNAADSMTQLTASVNTSVEGVSQATELAFMASSTASFGGELVIQVATQMLEIKAASHKVLELLKVLDGITFQTNLLALNARVEAAHAGINGKAFGVIATEIKILASRSESAARDIKALVTQGVTYVDQGAELMKKTELTMADAVSSSLKVSEWLVKVGGASKVQVSGVHDMWEAVGFIDQVTQHNAMLSTGLRDAADKLKGQTNEVLRTVKVFRLDAPLA